MISPHVVAVQGLLSGPRALAVLGLLAVSATTPTFHYAGGDHCLSFASSGTHSIMAVFRAESDLEFAGAGSHSTSWSGAGTYDPDESPLGSRSLYMEAAGRHSVQVSLEGEA